LVFGLIIAVAVVDVGVSERWQFVVETMERESQRRRTNAKVERNVSLLT
jgi:hypothetical protein